MASVPLQTELTEFFDRFSDAFLSFDGAAIAKRYLAPYSALNADGILVSMQSSDEIARYFQPYLDRYRSEGCRSCRHIALEALALGSRSALATVTWELLSENRRVLTSWRESYNLTKTPDGWRIFTSIDHA